MMLHSDDALLDQLAALIADGDGTELRRYCHLSNASALLAQRLSDINWVGFYLTDASGQALVLGPFQGKVACTDIPFSKGVCGLCARTAQSVRVDDVHAFAGHIACDGASNSELVVPLIDTQGKVVGVLDVDSPFLSRFTIEDQNLLEKAALIISRLFDS
ncbi:GAF domain-containing protein [Sphaerochaeta globosa]|uniref:Putative GAF sensor protein n=1 Tax=Sphaerochaeta globosa (strain ATCC BAA-1886 / DSM 22777 / Buddy) TaxID=158189 RepID=F0RS90_SPHGB|nr:GAF domain-containing protein [Sphaerochaeta globosa]ADY14695.1 putative GAF sensor protein [Sphaerochaeta globosa str. Buddy]